jgi:predicted nucleic acid-binding Zn ribbon protein
MKAMRWYVEHRVQEIVKLRERGWTMRQIGEFFGVSRQRVHQLLQRAHVVVTYHRHCRRCGKAFETVRANRVFCSIRCSKTYKSLKVAHRQQSKDYELACES